MAELANKLRSSSIFGTDINMIGNDDDECRVAYRSSCRDSGNDILEIKVIIVEYLTWRTFMPMCTMRTCSE